MPEFFFHADAAGDYRVLIEPVGAPPPPAPIVAKIIVPALAIVGQPADFSASVTGGEDGFTYAWDFGDGGTSQEINPRHTYQRAGQFDVMLTVADTAGHVGIARATVTVADAPPPPTPSEFPGSPVAVWVFDGDDSPKVKLMNRVRPGGSLSLVPMNGSMPGVVFIDATGAKVSGKPDSEVADRWLQATEGPAPDEIPYFDGWMLWEFVRDLDAVAPLDRYEGGLTHPAADISVVYVDLLEGYVPYLHFSRSGTGTSEEFGSLVGSRPLPPIGEVWRVLMTWHCRREGESRNSELRLYYEGETTPEVTTLPRVFPDPARPHQLNIGNEPEFQHGGESVCCSGRVRKVLLGGHELMAAEVGQVWAWLGGAMPPPLPPQPTPLTVNAGADFTSPELGVVFQPSWSGGTPPYFPTWNYGDGNQSPDNAHAYADNGTYLATLTVRDSGTPPQEQFDPVEVIVQRTVPPPPPDGDPDIILTDHDAIPNFGRNPTLKAVVSGNWGDLSTWGGSRVPNATDVVEVPANLTVVQNLPNATAKTISVKPSGKFLFKSDSDTKLTVQHLLPWEGSELRAEVLSAVRFCDIVIADVPLDVNDPTQIGNGLIGLGNVVLVGAPKTPWVECLGAVAAGATAIQFLSPVISWKVGDLLCVSSGVTGFTLPTEGPETAKIASVAADGLSVTLNAPLANQHDGPVFAGNLTRNVRVRSERASGVRGHTISTHNGMARYEYVAFAGLGRTTYELLGPGNQIGRYSGHFHHGTNLYKMLGCAHYCPMVAHPFKWGTAIHDSKGLCRKNVFYNWAGAGLYIEDDLAKDNIVEDNLIVLVRGRPGVDRFDFGMKGEGLAAQGGSNWIRRNVVCNADDRAYSAYATGPLREYSGRAYFCGAMASTWNLNGAGTSVPNPNALQSTFGPLEGRYFALWGVGLGYPSFNLTYDGLKVQGDGRVGTYGFQYGDYDTRNFIVRNADIRGMRFGVEVPLKTNGQTIYKPGTFTLEDSYLDNEVNVIMSTPGGGGTGGAASCRPRDVTLRNVKYGPNGRLNIAMQFEAASQSNLLVRDRLFITAHNGNPADNFRVYYREQAAGFKMPRGTDFGGYGAPVANLTNAQLFAGHEWRLSLEPFDLQFRVKGSAGPASTLWAVYDSAKPDGWLPVCVAGEPAPADAVDGLPWGIDGLVKRI